MRRFPRVTIAFLAVATLCVAEVSCSGSTSSGSAVKDSGTGGAGNDSGTGFDSGVDAPPDTSTSDVVNDVVADVPVEDAPILDVAVDVPIDTAPDVQVETGSDAGFTPGSLNDLVVWLAADLGVVAPSGSVLSWNDQSGQQNHATQGSATSQPLVLSAALNGLPAIHFDGVADHLSLPPGLADFTLGVSAFVVVRPASNTILHATRFFDFSQSYGSLTNSVLLVRFTSTGDELLYQTYPGTQPGEYVSAPGVVANGLWQSFSVVAAGGTPQSSVAASLYEDGVAVGGGVVNVPSLVVRNSNFIGRSNLSSNPYFKGEIAEVIIYARGLTDAERLDVQSYLDTKWGL